MGVELCGDVAPAGWPRLASGVERGGEEVGAGEGVCVLCVCVCVCMCVSDGVECA